MSYTIGRAAKAAGVHVETIRFYEREGVIAQPEKPRSGFRRYDDEVVKRIRFIKRAQNLGFTLAEIEGLLDLSDGDRAEVRARAEAKVAEVSAKIADLQRIRGALEEVIASCRTHHSRACPILQALSEDEQTPREAPTRKRS